MRFGGYSYQTFQNPPSARNRPLPCWLINRIILTEV